MDVWNYRGAGSWSFVALKRPGDERLFCGRNNTSGRIVYSRACLKVKGDEVCTAKLPSTDFVINPKEPSKFVPIIDVASIHDFDKNVAFVFRPWFLVMFSKTEKRPEITKDMLGIFKSSVMIFRMSSRENAEGTNDAEYLGFACASINDATCLSLMLDVDYYDTERTCDAA